MQIFNIFSLISLLSVLLASGNLALADEPTPKQLQDAFSFEIPGEWHVEDFTVEVSQNVGSAVEPLIKSRFRSTVILTADTFISVANDQGVVILAPKLKRDETRTVYGISTAELNQGAWKISFEVQGQPFANVGAPRGAYAGRTLIDGSDEHRAFLEEANAKAEAAEQAYWNKIQEDNNKWLSLLSRGQFTGQTSRGNLKWPFEVKNVVMTGNNEFLAEKKWITLGSIHEIKGKISLGQLVYQTERVIQHGNAAQNCVFRLNLKGENAAIGTYLSCNLGVVELLFQSLDDIQKQKLELDETIRKLVEVFWASNLSEGVFSYPDQWACAREPCLARAEKKIYLSVESVDKKNNSFVGVLRWESGSIEEIIGRIKEHKISFITTGWRKNPHNLSNKKYGYFGEFTQYGISGVSCAASDFSNECPDRETRFSLKIK